MNLHGIEIPREIIDAINEERLVIFAGAGVSMGSPTSLPSFKKLSEYFSKKNFITTSENFDTANDRFLGRLESENIYVHNIISRIFSDEKLEPNNHHKTLINLFGKKRKVRIVTTNYDEMFEKVCEEKGIKTKVYSNPALPYGNDFEGIVHLHGVSSDPKNLVATDKDFGKVYMYYSNATKFLSDLFNSDYVILFVGYSYNDLIMRYFTKAIPQTKAKRYIFVDDITIEDVKGMGLIPIRYEIDDFENMYASIQNLSEFVNRDAFSWDNRILQIANTNPSFIDLQTEGELRHILTNIHLIHKFLRNVSSLGWLIYFNYKGYLKNLFADGEFSGFDYEFAEWIIENFMIKDFEEFKYLLVKNNFKINISFQNMIIDKMDKLEEKRIEEVLSFTKLEKVKSNILIKIAKVLERTNLKYYNTKLIKYVIKLTYEYRKLSNFLEEKGNKEIEIKAETFVDSTKGLDIYRDISTKKCLDYEELLDYASGQLINLYNKKALGDVNHNFLNHNILTKQQVSSDMDVYIYIMKDILENVEKRVQEDFVEKYLDSNFGVLRRLARYISIKNGNLGNLVSDDYSKKENQETIRILELFSYEVDEKIKNKYIDNVEEVSITKKELEEDLAVNIDKIINYEGQGKSRESLLKDISDLCESGIEFAKSILKYLIEKNIYIDDIWNYILKGLSENKLVIANLEELLGLMSKDTLLENETYPISLFMKRIIEKNEFEVYENKLDTVLEFMSSLFEYSRDYYHNEKFAWSDITFNSSNGVISHVLIKLLQKNEESKNRYENKDKILEIIEKNLSDEDDIDVKFVTVGNFSMIYNIDKKWAKENLLPFFETSKTEEFRLSWRGFLSFSRLYPEISVLLDDSYKTAINRLDEIDRDGKFRGDFVKSYTRHFINESNYPLDYYIPSIYRLKNSDIKNYYSALFNFISEHDKNSRENMWEAWLSEFIQNRIASIPTELKDFEISFILKILIEMNMESCNCISRIPLRSNLDFNFLEDINLESSKYKNNKALIDSATYISNTIINERYSKPNRYLIDFLESIVEKTDIDLNSSDLIYNLNILGIK